MSLPNGQPFRVWLRQDDGYPVRVTSSRSARTADPFAGSGMTGVAAAALGRRARLFDISVLGCNPSGSGARAHCRDVLTKAQCALSQPCDGSMA